MALKFLSKFEGDLNRLGVKYSLTRKDMEEILEFYFLDLKSFITDPRMPKVKIDNLGTFKPALFLINRTISKYYYWRRLGSDNSRKIRSIINRLWRVRKRIHMEKNKVVTFKQWHKNNYFYGQERLKDGEIFRYSYNSGKQKR
jgi:hypothetical protein